MRVLVTGATGGIGLPAVAGLAGAGHEVTGVARDDTGDAALLAAGAVPIRLDVFDRRAVAQAAGGHGAILHLASSIPPGRAFTRRAAWDTNDRLRDEATAILVDAALAADAGRVVLASISLVYADGGTGWIDEDHPVAPVWEPIESALAGERHVGRFTDAGGTGVSLRFGRLYGPGRAAADTIAAIRARRMPIVGSGGNFVSSIHAADAGAAAVLALGAPAGAYNVVDDEPVTAARYTTALAEALDAPRPRRIPRGLALAVVGGAAHTLTISHRVSNRRFREATGWSPRFGSVREGFTTMTGG